MSGNSASRDGFSSGFGVIAATLGSAVGLGNIWMFPYQVGMNGGAGFLLIYLLATLVVGLPLMIGEISLGRSARSNPISAYRKLAPGSGWWLIGAMGLLSVLLIMSFYSSVVGWVFAYVGKSLGGSILTQDRALLEGTFGQLIQSPMQALGWQWAVLLVVGGIITLGVSRGIEAVTKRLMPLLFVLLIAVAIASLSLPGAMEGVRFLFLPDWSRINGQVVLMALGLAFFKLSLAVGSMMIYGSYFRQEQNIPRTAVTVMLADLSVSLLAGLAIFPAVFALGFNPSGGPALLFQTIPAVFASMPLGHILLVVFFVLTALAAIGAMLSLVEVPVAFLHEHFHQPRTRATWCVIVVLVLLGSLSALSASSLSGVQVAGKSLFDLFDFVSSKLLMPICGLLSCIFIARRWGREAFVQANSNGGTLPNQALLRKVFFVLTRITPVLIAVVMGYGLVG